MIALQDSARLWRENFREYCSSLPLSSPAQAGRNTWRKPLHRLNKTGRADCCCACRACRVFPSSTTTAATRACGCCMPAAVLKVLTSLSHLHLCEIIRASFVGHIDRLPVFPLRPAVDQLVTTLWCETTDAAARCCGLIRFGYDTVHRPEHDAIESFSTVMPTATASEGVVRTLTQNKSTSD